MTEKSCSPWLASAKEQDDAHKVMDVDKEYNGERGITPGEICLENGDMCSARHASVYVTKHTGIQTWTIQKRKKTLHELEGIP